MGSQIPFAQPGKYAATGPGNRYPGNDQQWPTSSVTVIHSDFTGGTFDGRPVSGHYQEMTEPPEPSIQPTPANAAPPPYVARTSRLYQAAAWVVIVAGIVFVVAVIFFTGAAVAWHNQPYRYHHHGLFRPDGSGPGGPGGPGGGQWLFVFPGGPPPGMGPGGPGGPPMMSGPGGPGMGPGGPGQGPSAPPSLAPPSPPSPPAP